MTPSSSKDEIVLLCQIALSTTNAGLLMAAMAVTGPAGPPFVSALFKETMPRHAKLPQTKPQIIRSHLVS